MEQDLHEGSWEHGPTVEGNAKNQKLLALDSANRAMVGSVAVVAEDSPNKPARRSRLGLDSCCVTIAFMLFRRARKLVSFILQIPWGAEGRRWKLKVEKQDSRMGSGGRQERERKEGERKGKKEKRA